MTTGVEVAKFHSKLEHNNNLYLSTIKISCKYHEHTEVSFLRFLVFSVNFADYYEIILYLNQILRRLYLVLYITVWNSNAIVLDDRVNDQILKS